MGPDIGAVEIYEDRHVADDSNRMLRAIRSKRLPLFKKKELHGAADGEIRAHLLLHFFHRHRIAMRQFTGPAVPAFQLETRAQSIEQNEVIEPPLVLAAKGLETSAGIRRSGANKIARRFKQ